MRRHLPVFAAAVLLLCGKCAEFDANPPALGQCQPPASHLIEKVKMHHQVRSNWCWAASGQMVMEYLGTDLNQCDQANSFLRRTPCCGQHAPKSCNRTGWPSFGRYGFSYKRNGKVPLSWPAIKEELGCANRPIVAARQSLGSDTSHIEVIVGYDETGDEQRLFVLDPLEEETSWLYDQYRGYDYNPNFFFVHIRDYYQIQPKD